MRSPAAPRIALVLLGLLATASAGRATEEFLERTVEVPEEGWVEVPVPFAGAVHAVTDPSGEELAFWLVSAGEAPRLLLAKVTPVREVPEGWWVELDLGKSPPRHERLHFATREPGVAPRCRLESSRDRRRWVPLAEGELFRLGATAELAKTVLEYPPVDHRYLRLLWPRAAGLPQLERLAAESAAAALIRKRLDLSCSPAGDLAIECAIEPRSGMGAVRRLGLEASAASALGYRLYETRDGRWALLREGVWSAAAPVPHLLTLPVPRPVREALRLELTGEGDAPVVEGVTAHADPLHLLFRAGRPGRHRVTYVEGLLPEGGCCAARPEEAAALRLAAGPEEPAPAPALALARPAVALPAARFAFAWRVRAPGAPPGAVVALELPPDLYRHAQPSLSDVRLGQGPQQVPYILRPLERPALAHAVRGAVPQPSEDHRSLVSITTAGDLPAPLEVQLTAPPGVFSRRLHWSAPAPKRAALDAAQRLSLAATVWECGSRPPLPCRHELVLGGALPHESQLEIEDGDNPPLPRLDLLFWRRRHELRFHWPGGEELRLLAGADLAAPTYDLAGRPEDLLSRPAVTAVAIALGKPEPAGGEAPKWLLVAALAAAAVVLLFVLGRAIGPRAE